MKLIDIPTDNLYKFMALSGLVLIAASYLPLYHGRLAGVDLAKAGGDKEIIELEAEWAREEADSVGLKYEAYITRLADLTGISKSQIITTLNAGQSLCDIKEGLEEHQVELEKLESTFRHKHRLFRDQIVKTIQLNTTIEVINRRFEELLWFKGLALAGALSGFVLAIVGFLLWYTKLQAPQDMLVKLKIKDEQK
jgi:hypothetical protein